MLMLLLIVAPIPTHVWLPTDTVPPSFAPTEQSKLERAILNPKQLHRCEVCGRGFLTHFGRAKYCRDCAAKVHRKQKAESARKRRPGVDK